MALYWDADELQKINDHDIPIVYHDSSRRRPSRKPRHIKISDVFSVPEQHTVGWRNLQNAVTEGLDLTPYLSKRHRSINHLDGLLNDRGIHHFHLGNKPDKNHHFVERTGWLVFAYVTDDSFYVITTFNHDGWCNQDMIEILHRNWPESIQAYKLNRIIGEKLNDDQREALRKKNCIYALTTQDGTVYGPLSGGVTAGGLAISSVIQADMERAKIRLFSTV